MNQNPTPFSAPRPEPVEGALPRRDFLKTSATLAAGLALGTTRPLSAASQKRVMGANDRIRIAQIGCGSRGRDAHLVNGILPHKDATNFEVVAIADVWKGAREKMNAVVQKNFGRPANSFSS